MDPDWCRGRRVLVTGAAGFLGGHVVEGLEASGAHVGGVVREGRSGQGAATYVCDLAAGGFLRCLEDFGPDVLLHLAGHASVPASFEDPRTDFRENVTAWFEVLEAVRRAGGSVPVILVSSAAVYGTGGAHALRESQLPAPSSPYGAAKVCMESYLEAYCRGYGLRGASVRLFSLFGPGLRRHVVYDLMVKMTRSPERIEVAGDGDQVRDFLYVSDCVDALVTVAARAPLRGERYNAAGGAVVTIRQLVDEISQVLGVAPAVTYSGRHREGEIDKWVADCSRIRELGFEASVSLEEGLRRTAEWFKGAHPESSNH